jgi:putative exporter of polyketide antibiotics
MAEPYPTTNRGRAWRLLAGGAVGGVIAWLAAGIGCAIAFGPNTWLVVALAGTAAVVFFAAGQLVQVLFAEAEALQMMMAGMASYVVRVGGLAAVAVAITKLAPQLNALALVVTVVAVVVGWLAAEIWVFTRLRIPAFDPPQAKTD